MERSEYNKKYYQEHKDYFKQKNKEIHSRWNPIQDPIKSPRQLTFKDKRLILDHNPRKGICENCNRKVGEEIKRTNIHHINYHNDDPLRDTIELCVRCHRQRHIQISLIESGKR